MNSSSVYQNDLILQEHRKGFSMIDHNFNLTIALDDLISQYADYDSEGYSLNIDSNKIDPDEITNLIYLYIESEGRDVSECFTDPTKDMENDDVTCALLAVLKNNSFVNQKNLSNLIVRQSFNCHKKQLQKLLDQRCDYLTEELIDEKRKRA